MSLRYSLAATMALLGAAALTTPAAAIEQVHIPDASAANNSGPPDALFDKSIPTTWQKKSDAAQNGGAGSFHFSVNSSSGQPQSSNSFGEDAKVPGSEFQQNGTVYQDPYFSPR
jgi:hypothetical protein